MTTTVEALQPLTPKQRSIYDWIVAYHARERIGPSVRDVQTHFNFSSPNGAVCHVHALVKKGWLERRPNKARAILPTLEALNHGA
jgi:repressor LexA